MNMIERVDPASYPTPACSSLENVVFLQQILQSQRQGKTCLPSSLGLVDADFQALTYSHPDLQQSLIHPLDELAQQRSELRQQLLFLRQDEWQDLCQLLIANRAMQDAAEIWLAQIVAAACLGGEHLWRDLGLESRTQLRELLEHNFPVLAQRNDKDMRWKKFFYKQLCEQEGGYVCRSPTCEQCPTYQDCFGEEV